MNLPLLIQLLFSDESAPVEETIAPSSLRTIRA